MTPYYQDDWVTIYHAESQEILPYLDSNESRIVSDPPYGIAHRPSDYWGNRTIAGDSERFDPTPLLTFSGCLLFGANHYADKLPPSPGWIVWNKRDRVSRGLPGSDAELAWTNMLTQVRIFTHVWLPHTLRDEHPYHPTQKPVALMRRIVSELPGRKTVVDPYMGSGSTLLACKDLGIPAVGIEIEERYCEKAARRCAQEVLELGAV